MIVCVQVVHPPRECSPNDTRSWYHKSSPKRWHRDQGKIACLAAGGIRLRSAVVSVVWHRPPKHAECYRPRDEQNAKSSLKWAIDGCVDAKLLPDDSKKYLSWGPLKWSDERRPYIELMFEGEPL